MVFIEVNNNINELVTTTTYIGITNIHHMVSPQGTSRQAPIGPMGEQVARTAQTQLVPCFVLSI